MRLHQIEALAGCFAGGVGLAAGWLMASDLPEERKGTSEASVVADGILPRGESSPLALSATAADHLPAFADAVAAIGEFPLGFTENYELAVAIAQLRLEEFSPAAEILGRLPKPERGKAAIDLVKRWSELDPSSALSYAESQAPSLVEVAYEALAAQDPRAALARAQNLPRAQRAAAFTAVVLGWATSDPEAALQWVNALPVSTWQITARQKAVEVWARTDARRAILYAMAERDPSFSVEALAKLFTIYAHGNLPDALGLIPQLSGGWRQNALLAHLAQELAERDPESAASMALRIPPGGERERMWSTIAEKLARRDYRTALAWVEQLPAGQGRRIPLNSVLWVWAAGDPVAAADYVLREVSPWDRSDALAAVIPAWGESDPLGALNWARKLDFYLRDSFTGNLLSAWSAREPLAALQYVQTQMTGREQQGALGTSIAAWADVGPAAAAEWLAALPESESRQHGMFTLGQGWASTNPAAASQWLDRLSPGPSRDMATVGFVLHTASTDPRTAAKWAITIRDPEQRRQAVLNAYGSWKDLEPDAARAWLKKSGAIESSLMEKLLK